MSPDPTTTTPHPKELSQPPHEARSEDMRLLTPEGFIFRPRTYHLPELKRALDDTYREWKDNLPESEYDALLAWYGRGFREINAQLRKGDAEATQQLQKRIVDLASAIRLAPSVPSIVSELFRGESHQLLTVEEAKRRCEERIITNLSQSFLATSIYENEAFNFARDYHASGYTESGLMIPIGALQKPVEQQVIYKYILPDDRTDLRAAWIGQPIGEMLFAPNTHGQWLNAEQVAYIPADDMESLLVDRKSSAEYASNSEKRLLVTIQLLPNSAHLSK